MQGDHPGLPQPPRQAVGRREHQVQGVLGEKLRQLNLLPEPGAALPAGELRLDVRPVEERMLERAAVAEQPEHPVGRGAHPGEQPLEVAADTRRLPLELIGHDSHSHRARC